MWFSLHDPFFPLPLESSENRALYRDSAAYNDDSRNVL